MNEKIALGLIKAEALKEKRVNVVSSVIIGEAGNVQEVLQHHWVGHHHSHHLLVRISAGGLVGLQLLAQYVG